MKSSGLRRLVEEVLGKVTIRERDVTRIHTVLVQRGIEKEKDYVEEREKDHAAERDIDSAESQGMDIV